MSPGFRGGVALVLLLGAGAPARGERVVGDFVLGLEIGADAGREMYATRANGAELGASAAGSYPLLAAAPRGLCATPRGGSLAGAAVVAERGGCSFEVKLRNAAAGGAALLVVFGSVEAAYANASSSYALADPCAVDCASGSFRVRASADGRAQRAAGFGEQCASRCASGACAASGVLEADTVRAGDELEACCLPDELMLMNLGGAMTGRKGAPDLPAVYALRADGERLLAAAASGARVSARDRARMAVDPSLFAIWAMGVSAVALATWLSTAAERRSASLVGADGAKASGWEGPEARAPAADNVEDDSIELTAMHALSFVLVASVSLVGMFALLQMGMFWVIRVVQIFFCVGCLTAIFQFGAFPLVQAAQPRLTRVRLLATEALGDVSAADGLALLLSACLVAWYYLCRHARYAWALQDTMALAMCAMFLRTVRLPNVRVASVLLSAFFAYDIFMVFLSPLLFNKSVMVEVATAGAAGEARHELSGDGRTCAHIQGERMPVLFMVPRLDYGGGYAMLGLGDVVMPGLLVCFALRYDCERRAAAGGARAPGGRAGPSYFALLVVGYAVGLLLALLANVFGLTFNGVRGQPALLYLVPCTLGPLALAAAWRGELGDMWAVEGLDSRQDGGGPYAAHGAEGDGRGPAERAWADAPQAEAGTHGDGDALGPAAGQQSSGATPGASSREHQGRPLLDP